MRTFCVYSARTCARRLGGDRAKVVCLFCGPILAAMTFPGKDIIVD